MPKSYTPNFKEKTGSTTGQEPVYMLEITHPQLAVPIRVVNDTQDLEGLNNIFETSAFETSAFGDSIVYIACAFRIKLPDDLSRSMPRAEISVDNIGRELTQWLEASNGGKGATVRMMQVMRNTPDIIELDFTLDLFNVRQNMLEVAGELGYEAILDQPALAATQTPELQPSIF